MSGIYPLVIFLILLASGVILCLRAARKGDGAYGVLYVSLFMLSLYAAFLIKLRGNAQLTNAFIPFYKLFALREYGYASILQDLLAFAAPFFIAGILIMPAFYQSGLAWAFVAGVLASLAFNVYPLFNGASFVTDEYVYAGLGCATGAAVYAVLASLFKKRLPLEKLRLPVPLRRRVRTAGIVLGVMYFFIALVMVFDYGERYAPIQFFDSETALPKNLTLDTPLSAEAGRANIFIPDAAPAPEKAAHLAQELGIGGGTVYTEGVYVTQDDAAKLTFTDSGSWVYERTTSPAGDVPARESAVAGVFAFFEARNLLGVELGLVDDIVEHKGSDGLVDGYEIYLSCAISGMPIVGSSTLVVSVRAQNSITKIRRYDGDVVPSTVVAIISQQKAYEKVLEGQCAYTLFAPASSAKIESCRIIYMANSSQGYYLPVWMFTCTAQYVDGTTGAFDIYVEAMR